MVKLQHGHAIPREVNSIDTFEVQPFGEDMLSEVHRRDLAVIIGARVEEIFEMVLQEAKRSGYDGLLPAGVVLTGGNAQLPGIRQVAASVMKYAGASGIQRKSPGWPIRCVVRLLVPVSGCSAWVWRWMLKIANGLMCWAV